MEDTTADVKFDGEWIPFAGEDCIEILSCQLAAGHMLVVDVGRAGG